MDARTGDLLTRERACLQRAANLRRQAAEYEREARELRQAAWRLQHGQGTRALIVLQPPRRSMFPAFASLDLV